MTTYNKGGCLCGNIRYTITGKPSDPHLCHCTMCQKWSGAPVVAWVDFPLASIKFVKAKPKLYRSSKRTRRGFCPNCGSALFALDDDSDLICMTTATVDRPERIKPRFESFRQNGISWMKKFLRPIKSKIKTSI